MKVPEKKFKNRNSLKSRKEESRTIAIAFFKEGFMMLCSRLKMPQGKRRFKIKFKE